MIKSELSTFFSLFFLQMHTINITIYANQVEIIEFLISMNLVRQFLEVITSSRLLAKLEFNYY